MDVAILYSGGKDSTYAIDYCLNKGYNIKYLLSVKPNRTDCFLFHYATVELTKDLAKILGLKHILVACKVSDPKKEAQIVKDIVEKEDKVDAIILGGIGLQVTQINSIREAVKDLNIKVFASHENSNHGNLVEEMIDKGYKIIISQFAADGLGEEWLGRELTKENYKELRILAKKYGFHEGFEGGPLDTLVIDGPIFNQAIELIDFKKNMESKYSGHLIVNKIKVVPKLLA